MPVEPVDHHGMIGRDGVDPLLRGIDATPVLVVPIAAGDPCALRDGRCEGLDAFGELFAGFHASQLNGREAESTGDEVDVRVGEAGHDETAVALQHDC